MNEKILKIKKIKKYEKFKIIIILNKNVKNEIINIQKKRLKIIKIKKS
jgi:hypothetical protein